MAYDPAARPSGRHCVTAVFESDGDARRARDDLIALGFAADDIAVKSAAAQASAPNRPVEDPGIFKSLLDIFVFMPSHDRMTVEEALRRGGVALSVRTGPDTYEQAIDTLDRDGAIDLEEREISWTEDGWTSANESAPTLPARPTERSHDPLVDPSANPDVRERIGTGTADMTAGLDPVPSSAASPAVRDTSHGRHRVRSYMSLPAGIDPQI